MSDSKPMDTDAAPSAAVEEEKSKKSKDLSHLADKHIPEYEAMAKKPNQLLPALEGLLQVEKQARQAQDAPTTGRLLICIAQLCFNSGDLDLTKQHLTLVTKRRGQLKSAVQRMVQHVVKLIEEAGDGTALWPGEKLRALVQALVDLTEGKIYVECERARLVRRVAGEIEASGDVARAAELLRGVQVETFAAMDAKEKVDYILEQLRLCLDAGDDVRAYILSKKVDGRVLRRLGFEQLLVRFHELMVRYYRRRGDHLQCARSYLSTYEALSGGSSDGADSDDKKKDSKKKKADDGKGKGKMKKDQPKAMDVDEQPKVERTAADDEAAMRALLRCCCHAVLGRRSPAQQSMLHQLLSLRALQPHHYGGDANAAEGLHAEVVVLHSVVTLFVTNEVISFGSLSSVMLPRISKLLPKLPVVKSGAGSAEVEDEAAVLKRRCMEHNVHVIAKHYTSIRLHRLSELVGGGADTMLGVEELLCDMVISGAIEAKIDRPRGVVTFGSSGGAASSSSSALDEWSSGISSLLSKLEDTSEKINKALMGVK